MHEGRLKKPVAGILQVLSILPESRIENNRYLLEGSRGGVHLRAGIVVNGFVRMRHCELVCGDLSHSSGSRSQESFGHFPYFPELALTVLKGIPQLWLMVRFP